MRSTCIVECYVCHESVAVPANADRDKRWIHTHCSGNTPTVTELVAGFLAALPSDRFCLDCLGRLVGVTARQDLDTAIAALGHGIRVATGRCARCPARTRVVGLHSNHDT
jgi:hypothetical protein